jgi:hypothetical protein
MPSPLEIRANRCQVKCPHHLAADSFFSVNRILELKSSPMIAGFSANRFARFHNFITLWGLNLLFVEARSLLRKIHMEGSRRSVQERGSKARPT